MATKQQLQFQLESLSQFEISQKYQDVLNKLNEINSELTIGSSVLIALITNKKLYIAHIGVCRALLVKNDEKNNLIRVIQVTVDHNLYNEDELLRLCGLGLEAGSLRSEIVTTRCIGNYMGKGGYKDSEFLSQSFGEPIIAEPEVIGPITIDESARFLMLLSGGLCRALSELYRTEDLNIVNSELVSLVVNQFNKQSTLVGVAQSVINQISQLHHDEYIRNSKSSDFRFNSRDDMTLLIRNFSFEMPHSIESQSIESSKQSSIYSGGRTLMNTNSSYSSTNTSVNYSSSYATERTTSSYVSFKDYFENVEQARKEGKLPPNIDFDDAPLE